MLLPLIPFDSPSITNQIIDDFQYQPNGLYIVRTSNLTEHPKPVVDPDDVGTDVVVTGYVVVRQDEPVKAKRLVVELLTELELALSGARSSQVYREIAVLNATCASKARLSKKISSIGMNWNWLDLRVRRFR
jgi:hypothetical protein